MEEHKHIKNELNISLQGRDTVVGRGQHDISCSLEDKRKVVISR